MFADRSTGAIESDRSVEEGIYLAVPRDETGSWPAIAYLPICIINAFRIIDLICKFSNKILFVTHFYITLNTNNERAQRNSVMTPIIR